MVSVSGEADKKITLDNIERTEIVTSDLDRDVEQIEADRWGTEDISVPIRSVMEIP